VWIAEEEAGGKAPSTPSSFTDSGLRVISQEPAGTDFWITHLHT
jgi:hypothetical protein